MRTIKEWQVEAHRLATEKGFHSRECLECHDDPDPCDLCLTCNGVVRMPVDPHAPTRIAARLVAIHGEVSEAYECVARGEMELYFDRSARHILGHDTHYMPKDMWDAREQALVYHYKPEGFPIELADVFLRLCDLAESVGASVRVPRNPCRMNACETPEEIAAELSKLHALTSNLSLITTQPASAVSDLFGRVYRKLNAIAVECNVDLLDMAELKHEFNKTRPIMHGKCL